MQQNEKSRRLTPPIQSDTISSCDSMYQQNWRFFIKFANISMNEEIISIFLFKLIATDRLHRFLSAIFSSSPLLRAFAFAKKQKRMKRWNEMRSHNSSSIHSNEKLNHNGIWIALDGKSKDPRVNGYYG